MTPICDLIAELTSRGLTLGDAIDVARKVEASGARSSGSSGEQRERWRIKAQEKRDRLKETSRETKAEGITSNNQLDLSDSKKKTRVSETSRETNDDWPADYGERFWKAFPPFRRQAKAKVLAKLARIRASGVPWDTVFFGVKKFAATNPGEFAPAPMVWLNDGRWDREYGSQQGGSNGASQGTNGAKVGFAGISARLRAAAAAEQDLPFERPSDGPRPDDRY